MPDRHVHLLYRLRQTLHATAGAVPDADLLDRFARGQDQAAFELLLWRHGPMVWGVCRRRLGHTQDAEDAFQAAFLALARRAGTLRNGTALAGWLYRVAHRAALAARTSRRRTILTEASAELPTQTRADDPARSAANHELAELLDDAVAGLPERFRLPFILCHLQGRTRTEAAAELRCPVGTVESRLHRARRLLRCRLARRGVALPAALAVPAVPASLRGAALHNAAVPAAAGLPAALLADRALGSLALAAPRKCLTGLLAACLLVTGAGLASLRSDTPPAAAPPSPPAAPAAVDAEPLPAEAAARVGSPRLRHGAGITAVAFSPDGKWIVSAAGDGTARLWEAATGRLRLRVPLKGSSPLRLYRAAFSPDGKSLVLLDGSSCRILDVPTGKEQAAHSIPEWDTAWVADLAPDGSRFATAQLGKDVSVRDARTGKELYSLPGSGICGHTLAFSADLRVVAVPWAGDPKDGAFEVRLFDAATGKPRGSFKDGKRSLGTPALSPDGKTVAALSSGHGGEDALVLWDAAGGQVVRRITGLEPTNYCITFSPDAKLLAVGNTQRLWLQLFDVATGKEVRRLRCWPSVTTVAFSTDGKTVAAGKSEGNISLWDVETGKTHPASSDPDGGIFLLRFSPDGRSLLTACGDVSERDWRTGRVVRRYPNPNREVVPGLSISADGKMMAACDWGGSVRLVDAHSGKDLRTLKGHGVAADQVQFAPDGRRLFTMGYDNTVRIWDVAAGTHLHCMHVVRVNSGCKLAVSPDGNVLAALIPLGKDPSEIRLWDTRRGTELHRLAAPELDGRALAFSPDGAWIACAGQDAENGRLGDISDRVVLWEVSSGRQVRSFSSSSGAVYDVAFSPDGRMLASAGHDHTVRLWEAASGKERHHFSGHESPAYRLAFSPDGRFLAAVSAEAPVYVWDVTGTARRRAVGPLSSAEKGRAWQSLADADTAAAFAVMRRLAAAPDEAVALLEKHLAPAPAADVERARRLVADLDADEFAVRERATGELGKVAEQVEGMLREARNGASLETRRRLDLILRKIDSPSAERLRQMRAVEVLEWLGSPAADRLLARLAGGAAGAPLTAEAAAARARMRRRTP